MTKRKWADGAVGNTPLNAARLNRLESDLDAALVQLAADPSSLFAGAVTSDADGAPVSAVVKWPDGADGNYSGTASLSYPGTVSAYTVTRVGTSTRTYTQPAVTRGPDGNITNRPPIIVTGDDVEDYTDPDPVQPASLDAALTEKINDAASDTRKALDSAYAFPMSQAITYNPDGSVATVTESGILTSYAYNSDGTVATDTRGGVTRTYTYTNGNLTGIEAA